MSRYYLLLGIDGTICATLRVGSGDPHRFWRIQMLDEAGEPIPSPSADAADPTVWVLDRETLPEGFSLREVPADIWEAAADQCGLKQFDEQEDDLEKKIKLRAGHEAVAEKSRAFIRCLHHAEVEQTCWAYGGIPIYRVKAGSSRAETDFPELEFTHRAAWRKTPISHAERAKAQERAQRMKRIT